MRPLHGKTPIGYDRWLLGATLALLALGLLMVASASMVISDRQYGQPFHYLIHQVICLILGLAIGWVVLRIRLEYWQKCSGYLLLFSLLLLIVVLLPGIGHQVNGSSRWFSLSFISFQASELAKFCVIIYLASYLVRHQQAVRQDFIGFIRPMLVLGLVSLLLLMEPDFGATTVIFATVLGVMFLAEMRLWQFIVLFLLVAAGLTLLAFSSPYRMVRLTTFLNPWANPFASGYQLTQSLIAFGRGGLWGVGLGNSIQKLFYLPEAHTDFLFAVIAEELGLIGELIVVGLFAVLVGRTLFIGHIAQRKNQLFVAYLAYGFGLSLGLQVLINIGVNAGVLPTKGLTLPLMSYGGSSMLINCVIIAILLRAAYEAKIGSSELPEAAYGWSKAPARWRGVS
ncbi:MAG: putative lipid II flippase FtsW [Gammaproteobacteria bacterium]